MKEIKKYMVITYLDEEQDAKFFDRLDEAEQYRMDAMCGADAYTEIYARDVNDAAYVLIYA